MATNLEDYKIHLPIFSAKKVYMSWMQKFIMNVNDISCVHWML